MSRRLSLALVVAQIVPDDSVKGRSRSRIRLHPGRDQPPQGHEQRERSGTQRKGAHRAPGHPGVHRLVGQQQRGPSRSRPVTAALTPGPEAVTSRANAAGQRHPGARAPRWTASISQGSTAMARRVTVVRFAYTTTNGLTITSRPATTWATRAGG